MSDVEMVFVPFNENAPIVVLDRKADVDGDALPYCVHGETRCINCRVTVLLGDRTLELVKSGKALPLCQPCAIELIPYPNGLIGRVQDRRHR